MPLMSPAGPLQTLDEAVADARQKALRGEAFQLAHPVLIVTAPAEPWSQVTDVRLLGGQGATLPPVVIPVAPRRLTQDETHLTFGRASICEVVLPFAALSKVHGRFNRAGPSYQVEDSGSTNGTVLNGAKVDTGRPRTLSDGAQLTFGNVTARFVLPETFAKELRQRSGV